MQKMEEGVPRANANLDVAKEIKEIISTVLKIDPSQLTSESRLFELAADSMDIIEMVFVIEEKFDINIVVAAKGPSYTVKLINDSESKEAEFNTIGDIIQAVKKILDAKAH